MSYLKPFLSFLVVMIPGAWAKIPSVNVNACEADLNPRIEQLLALAPAREKLDGWGTFLPGNIDDQNLHETKLISLRTQPGHEHQVAESIALRLHLDPISPQNPHLLSVIEVALKVAHAHHALFTISRIVELDRIRISLDMEGASGELVRLPYLNIREGRETTRIDIDITPSHLSVLTATTQTLSGLGKAIIGDPASHAGWLYIDGSHPQHPVLAYDGVNGDASQFFGPESKPKLNALVGISHEIARKLFPDAKDLGFRLNGQVQRVDRGKGWELN